PEVARCRAECGSHHEVIGLEGEGKGLDQGVVLPLGWERSPFDARNPGRERLSLKGEARIRVPEVVALTDEPVDLRIDFLAPDAYLADDRPQRFALDAAGGWLDPSQTPSRQVDQETLVALHDEDEGTSIDFGGNEVLVEALRL